MFEDLQDLASVNRFCWVIKYNQIKKPTQPKKNYNLGILKKVIKYQSSTTFQNQNQAFNSLSKTLETVENH